MASVVDTSVKHFNSAMVGAPTLSGSAGALLSVLSACLVDGFDVKAATTLVVASGVATLSFTGAHSASMQSVILVSGVTGALTALNGEQKITYVATGVVKFATAAADGTATGTISFKMAPLGWLKPFTGTNLAVFQSADVTSTKMFFKVDDTGTKSARLRGYELMTDIATGSGLFPLDVQISGGAYLAKSSVASATACKWRIYGNAKSLFINIATKSAETPTTEGSRTVFIGDFIANRPGGDPYAFAMGGGPSGGYNEANGVCDQGPGASFYCPRAYHGLGSSVVHNSVAELGANVVSGTDGTFGSFPSPIDGSLILSRRLVSEVVNGPVRGSLPGILCIPQSNVGLAIAPGTRLAGTGALTGRVLQAIASSNPDASFPSASMGVSVIDITGPWA